MDKKHQILLFISTYSSVVLARNLGIKHELNQNLIPIILKDDHILLRSHPKYLKCVPKQGSNEQLDTDY